MMMGSGGENAVLTEDDVRQRLGMYGVVEYKTPDNFSDLARAAVLIGLQIRDNRVHVLLTVRSKTLKLHPSTVAFPGGRSNSDSETSIETALRESHEEIGLERHDVEILCSFPASLTNPSFITTPFVGLINKNFTPKLNHTEVSELFWLPLHRFLSTDNHNVRTIQTEFLPEKLKFQYLLHSYVDNIDGKTYKTWGFTANLCIFTAVALFHEETSYRVIDTIPIDNNDVIGSIRQLLELYSATRAAKKLVNKL